MSDQNLHAALPCFPVSEYQPSSRLSSKLDLIRAMVSAPSPLRGIIAMEQSGLDAAKREDRDRAGLENSWVTHLKNLHFPNDVLDEVRAELAELAGSQWQYSELAGRSYYPSGGFMGWHSNHSRPGRRIYCIYNDRDGSSFRYLDNEETIQVLPERAGWTLRGFVIPHGVRRFWHALHAAGGPRFAIGFRLPTQESQICNTV